jgi:hypothetical protein
MRRCSKVEFSHLKEPGDLRAFLHLLESAPLSRSHFVELSDCPEPLASTSGALIWSDDLAVGGIVYRVVILDDRSIGEQVCGYAEVRASKRHPQPMFSLPTNGGHAVYDETTYSENPLLKVITAILAHVVSIDRQALIRRTNVCIRSLKTAPNTKPPTDQSFNTRFRDVLDGRLYCTIGRVSVADVKPYRTGFCLEIPLEAISQALALVSRDANVPLLLYWSGNHS